MNRTMTILGIDVGSVAVGVAVVDGDGTLLHTGYRFHHGEVSATIGRLLSGLGLTRIDLVAATGSVMAAVSSGRRYDNEICIITAAKRLHPAMRTLLKVGGEKFSLSTFDDEGRYLGSRTNSSCAAGTGSFLDQQALRLHLGSSKELADIAARGPGRCPKIASRCAVFAKTDLIHAQQEGYSLAEISNGLCQGLAKNIVDTLFVKNAVPAGEMIFCGGVARNEAVAAHIETLTGRRFVRPALGHLYGALGACYMALDEKIPQEGAAASSGKRVFAGEVLMAGPVGNKEYYYPPLALKLSTYPDFGSIMQYLDRSEGEPTVEVDVYSAIDCGPTLDVYLGIDIGSTSTKAVLMDDRGEVVAGFYTRTAGRPLVAVQALFRAIDTIQREKNVEFSVIQCGTTGSGRKFIGTLIGADGIIDEITAHGRAACQLNPEVDTIIEIGGQDAKFTTLQDGRVTSSTMNSVCAAGTGSFIEEQAAKLGCAVEDYSARAENQRAPMVSDRCTVFMERDINHYLSLGYTVNEVLAAALHAVRENYLQKVACEKHIGKTVFFQGATAKNRALVAAFEQRLARPIFVSKFCHLTGALGCALILKDEGKNSTAFRGFSLYRQQIDIRGEVCELCTNHCKISVADVGGMEVAYGFLCGRDYGTKNYVATATGAFELLRERSRITRFDRKTEGSELRIGLPAAVHMVEDLPMWRFFFDLLGLTTITSESCRDGLAHGKKLTRAEFCAPITAMHGHVAWLLDRAEYIFLPTFLEEKAKDVRRQYCYYTQFLPALIASMDEDAEQRILRPVVRYLYTSFHTKIELYRMMKNIVPERWSFFDVAQAYDKALQFKKESRGKMVRLMTERTGGSDIQVVFVGRPYSVLSPAMNGNIPHIFNKLGIDTFYQDMLSYEPGEVADIQPLLDEIHWEHGVRILEAAEVIARRSRLYPVFLTSFMCTPDAFTLGYFKKVMESHNKPYLILQLDEHDSSVGYETRIEAAVRSFRNHHQGQRRRLKVDYTPLHPRLDRELNRRYVIFPNWDAITCELLAATLRREGFQVLLIEESDRTIREGLRHNSGQCLPLNAVAQGYIDTMRRHDLDPADCSLWLNHATISCNIRLYPHHIKTILTEQEYGEAGVYVGQLSFAEISFRAAANAYFAYMLGGMLRRVACRIRPYEVEAGETDRVLVEAVALLSAAFAKGQEKEEVLQAIVTRVGAIAKNLTWRPQVAIFGDLYARDNRVMNQDLVRFIEAHGGEVVTTPYSEYAKMIAPSYFRKWFNEGKYLNLLAYGALLSTMVQVEKVYMRIFAPVLGELVSSYDDDPARILGEYNIQPENTGESMDNILKIHYIKKHFPDVSLFVQTSPSLCCPSLVTEAMRDRIERKTGVPVVSVTYDGTGGSKNEVILPYLKYPRNEAGMFEKPSRQFNQLPKVDNGGKGC